MNDPQTDTRYLTNAIFKCQQASTHKIFQKFLSVIIVDFPGKTKTAINRIILEN